MIENGIIVYGLIAFLSSLIILALAIFILTRNPEENLSRAFSAFLFCAAIGSLTEYLVSILPSPRVDDIIVRIGVCFWAFTAATFLHFSLIFSEKSGWLKKKSTYLLLFLPPIVLTVLLLFTDTMIKGSVKQWLGYVPLYTHLYALYFWQASLSILLGLIFIMYFSLTNKNPFLRKRGILIGTGFAITLIAAIAEGTLLPIFFKTWTIIPPYTGPFIGITCAITFYAMQRYSLFSISPNRAANAILLTASTSMIAVDVNLVINFSNTSAAKMLGNESEQILGKNLCHFMDEVTCRKLTDQLFIQKLPVKGLDVKIEVPGGGERNVLVNAVILKDLFGLTIGAVLDLQDITEELRTESSLKTHIEDIEKMNRFMTGRELQMIELKKKVNQLLQELGRGDEFPI
jgi:PAS domain S-box-containing protein